MRIISGKKRGHKLFEFEGSDIRPTQDRVRESIFNLICEYVNGSSVLDLFGGSGALSFEALSRGAKGSVIVDIDKRAVNLIYKNADSLGFRDEITVLNNEAMSYLKACDKKFDIIFLDPPYNKGFISPIIRTIIDKRLLSDDGIIVLESDNTDEHGEFYELQIKKQRRYGRAFVTIYSYIEN